MGAKARELSSHPNRLPAYVRPGPARVRHDQVWQRALAAATPGKRVTVQFPPEVR